MINTSSRRMLSVAVVLTLALVSCGDDVLGPRDVEFAASLGIDLDNMVESPSGLFYRDDVVGTGELAAAGDEVTLTYTGWLVNGTQFDSDTGYIITLNVTNLIAGFTEGVNGMQLGGTRTLVIPSELAYGSQGNDVIPANAVIVFEITITALVKAQA